MSHRFAHLQLHSEYSLADSTVRIEELVDAAAKRGIPALAITAGFLAGVFLRPLPRDWV